MGVGRFWFHAGGATTSDLDDPKADGAFTGELDQETFRALLFNCFVNQQAQTRAQRQENNALETLARASREAGQSTDLRAALNLIAVRAVELTGATGAAIAILRQGQMVCSAVHGPTAPPLGISVPLESGLSGECLHRGSMVACNETSDDPRVNHEACEQLGGVRSMLLVPLFRRRNPIGILQVFANRPSAFDQADSNVLELLAAIAATAVTELGELELPRASRSVGAASRPGPAQPSPF